MRICHRDLSPENLIILENETLIIDFGMCLRIPYLSDVKHLITQRWVSMYWHLIFCVHFLPFFSNAHNTYHISALWKIGVYHVIFIFRLHIVTNTNRFQEHMSPEIYLRRPFDGHAVDIWAGKLGHVWFILLMQKVVLTWPVTYLPLVYSAGTILLFMLTGRRFEILQWIEHPSLLDRVLDFHAYLGISYEAMDLLKHMLMLDPTHRYTLRQICAHPWMTQHN
jgi:serine/threonine protein kinase